MDVRPVCTKGLTPYGEIVPVVDYVSLIASFRFSNR